MSGLPGTATAPPSAAAGDHGPGPARRSRRATWLVVGLGLLVAVAVAVLVGDGARNGARLDPDNPGADGARAVARVLDAEGVDVTVVRGAEELEQAPVDGDTTLLVTRPDLLGEESGRRLLSHAGLGRLVVAGARPDDLAVLGVEAGAATVSGGVERRAECDTPALAARFDGLQLRVDDAVAHHLPGCFPGGDTGAAAGTVLSSAREDVLLLGAPGLLTNDQVLRADNAAIALRLLAEDPRLVWYVPSPDDLGAQDAVPVGDLLPRWLRPGLVLGLFALVALMVWRGRRLGPLATEPLPVVVRASETVHSRGRLYRRAGDRAHAAGALRAATRTRLAARLRLAPTPYDAGPGGGDALVRTVAAHTGRTGAEVAALLGTDAPAPTTDPDLITLAGALAELEEEVRHP